MKKILLFASICLSIVLITGCVSEKEPNTAAANQSVKKDSQQQAKKAWKDRVKANQTNQKATTPKPGKAQSAQTNKLKAKYKQPITPDQNKGVFNTEIKEFINLTPAKSAELEKLISKYKRKGLDFKFFGGFYNNDKPFARDLAKFLKPVEVEKFKHFHAYWYDRIPYPKPEMPVSLYYRLGLSKKQFIEVIDIYSRTVLAKGTNGASVIALGQAQIEKTLTAKQKIIYKEIISINKDQF